MVEEREFNRMTGVFKKQADVVKNIADKIEKIDSLGGGGVGKDVTGTKYTIDETEYTAGSNAEIFNDYTNNKAAGQYSHAEGFRTAATGQQAHAEGNATKALGNSSHAEGATTIASGTSSHAEGRNNTASGQQSHAEGDGTTASGGQSHAEGNHTIASSNCQHVQGKYNKEDSENKYAFIIGNGSKTSRSNAFAIGWDGLIYINNATTGIDLVDLVTKVQTLIDASGT